jgi:hypothetical protein
MNQSSDTSKIPQECNYLKKNSWFIQSNTFDISQKIPLTCIVLLIDLNILSVILKAAASVDIPFLRA